MFKNNALKFKSIKFQAFLYVISNTFSSALPILLLPFLSNRLNIEDYAVITNFSLIVMLLNFYMAFQGNTLLNREFFLVEKKTYSVYIYNVFVLTVVSLLILIGFDLIFGSFLVSVLGGHNLFPQIIAVGLCVFVTNQLALQKQMEKKPAFVLSLRFLQLCLEVGFTVLLVKKSPDALFQRVNAMVISSAVLGIFSLLYFYKNYIARIAIDKVFIKDALAFGIPIFFNNLFGWVMTSSSRLFLSKISNLKEVGQYSFSFQLALAISLIGNSINQAWMPWLFGKLAINDEASVKSIRKGIISCYLLISALVVFLILIVPLISPYMFNSKYKINLPVYLFICSAFASNAFYRILINFLFFHKKTKIISSITFICAFANIGLNMLLIPVWSSFGAAVATFASFFLGLLLVIIYVIKEDYLRVGFGNKSFSFQK
ncbi:oligosaccharide flippase family protein [Mucilaginibacter sp.]|uniref:lipopolysaccharide biosynthesis protein n=1 Tax=Mucilaginibacter sp. TaxID=1882438 RepID=UPI0025D6E69D|nr:oligosaccharide flippase family protein [Mucilaginibacter sp.]